MNMGDGVPDLNSISSNDIPQKENFIIISQSLFLLDTGISHPRELMKHLSQSYRQCNFLKNACKILGWLENDKLTKIGRRVLKSEVIEKLPLIQKSIRNSKIFCYLENEYNCKWYNDCSAVELSNFLVKTLKMKKRLQQFTIRLNLDLKFQ